MAGANIRTAMFNAEIQFWESCGALSWPMREFLDIFKVAPVFHSPDAMRRIRLIAAAKASTP